MTTVEPYSALANGYDLVMSHVDYRDWSAYIHDLIQWYHPDATTVLELGCGTASFGLELLQRGSYEYVGLDRSPSMLEAAGEKLRQSGLDHELVDGDFAALELDRMFDVVLLLFDGLNYLLEADRVEGLMNGVYQVVKPGGLFVFDQSTPANSVNNLRFFEDMGQKAGFAYSRTSEYDRDTRLHRTWFEIDDGRSTYHEEHVQRAYNLVEILPVIEGAGFSLEAALDCFTDDPAYPDSERIQWIVRRPIT